MKMEIHRAAERSEGWRKEIVNLRRPKEKGRWCWWPRPCCCRPDLTPEQPGFSSLWEALASVSSGPAGHTEEVSGITAPLLPSLGDAARRHPRLSRLAGTSVLPAEGNRHKASAHTMAGLCTRRSLQLNPPCSCLHSHLGNEGR